MKKIITAINNPKLNNKLNKEKNIEIICKDIQYKDAIIEILNKNKNIDIIFINEKIPGEINNEKLIKNIKLINKKIKIIYILEKQNKKIENILYKNNIKEIYYEKEINFNTIIKIINNKNNYFKLNLEKEKNKKTKKEIKNKIIKTFFKIKNKTKNINKKYKINNLINFKNNIYKKLIKLKNNIFKIITNLNKIKIIKNKLFKNLLIKNNLSKNKINLFKYKKIIKKINKIKSKNKIITFLGEEKRFKINFIINFSKIINNKKILIVDFNSNNKFNIYKLLKIKKYNKKSNEIIKLNKNNISEKINEEKNIKKIIKSFLIKINKNKFLISDINLLFKQLNKNNKLNIEIFIQNFLNYLKNNYDFILFNMERKNNKEINNIIFKNSDLNLILIESNFNNIKKFKNYLEKNNYIKNINLILNKKINKYSIDKNILNKIFKFNILGEI